MASRQKISSPFGNNGKESMCQRQPSSAFSLVEVVLAVGIFVFAIVGMIGLFTGLNNSVREVTLSDEIVSVVETVDAFLKTAPDIAPTGNRFDAIYSALQTQGMLTLFVFRRFTNGGNAEELEVGFAAGQGFPDEATIDGFDHAAGPVFRVLLGTSAVTPENLRAGDGSGFPGYTLRRDLANYPDGFLAMEVIIFAEPSQTSVAPSTPIPDLNQQQPVFTYDTAIVR